MLIVGRGRLPARTKLIGRDQLVIAYAFHQLMSPELWLPQLVIDEFRREFHGREAIDFMLNRGNRYPRADAIGIRLSDRARADLYIKEVDIAAGLRAVAFAGEEATPPLGRVGAAAWLDGATSPDDGLVDLPDVDNSLLPRCARCVRCSPSLIPVLLEQVRQSYIS